MTQSAQKISASGAAREIARLSEEIRRHNALYYQNDAPKLPMLNMTG